MKIPEYCELIAAKNTKVGDEVHFSAPPFSYVVDDVSIDGLKHIRHRGNDNTIVMSYHPQAALWIRRKKK